MSRVEHARRPAVPDAGHDPLGPRRIERAAEQRGRDPVERRAARARRGRALGVRAAGQDQAVAGARHRDVEQPPLLRVLLDRRRGGEPLVGERGHRLAAAGRRQAQPDLAVGADQQAVALARALAAEVGDADDRELEPLGAVDRHQPHRVEPLGLERRLALARRGEVARRGVGEEAVQVAPLRALVLARQAHQLAQVREPPLPARPREHREVVARPLERRARAAPRRAAAPRAPARRRRTRANARSRARLGGGEGRERVRRGGVDGRRRPQCGPHAAAQRAAGVGEQDQGVGADAAERRGEDAEQRLLVERVGERGEVGDAVADRLLGPVAAAADDVGRSRPAPRAPPRARAARPSRGRARRCRAPAGRRRPPRAAGGRARAPRPAGAAWSRRRRARAGCPRPSRASR